MAPDWFVDIYATLGNVTKSIGRTNVFVVDNTGETVPGQVKLASPANGATNVQLSNWAVTPEWASVTGATTYYLQVSEDQTFQTGVIDGEVSGQNHAYLINAKLGTTYYWRGLA